MIDSVFAIGLQGIKEGERRVLEGVQQVTGAFLPDSATDPVEGFIDIRQGLHQVQASAAVIRRADELTGSIIDILA